MKKIISTVVLVSLIATLGSSCVSAKNDEIKVTYDGQMIEFDVQPEIISDRVMVPMRTIFETFGMKVKWDGESQSITAKRKSKTVGMTIGSADMTKNEDTYTFDTAPVITDGRTLVPVRAISDLLELDVEWVEDEKTVKITTPADEENEAWKENTGTINLDTLEVAGDGVSVEDNVITVSAGGDFEITGTLDDGQIVVDTEDEVKLRLSGMKLTNKNGSAIYVKNADKAHITITENTENILADGETYTSGDENEKACITSRDNLEIKGKGTLIVEGNYNHGIDSSDSVEIGNGNITITAKKDAIHVNDTLAINGGNLTVTAESDGLQADEIVDITGGTINVTTMGEVPASTNTGFGGMNFGKTMQNPSQLTAEERQEMRDEFEKQFEEIQNAEIEEDNSDDVTSKGIKADWMLDISGGEITVNSTDHAIHCASDINIKGGKLNLASEVKKGISAHGNIVIDDGKIDITKATEGIETKQIMTINGGDINVIASDDGFNAGGDGMMMGGMGRPNGGQIRGNAMMSEDMPMPSGEPTEEGALMSRPVKPQRRDENMVPPAISEDENMTSPDRAM
ncbi:MAG: carbohydrate-binding domain-containing protein, partial [Clostridia bacterium]|nr:carbohydrate-binding domain-containing protein [Clostridia bacterium]